MQRFYLVALFLPNVSSIPWTFDNALPPPTLPFTRLRVMFYDSGNQSTSIGNYTKSDK